MIVIGLPKNMDGSEGPRAQKSHKLADTLRAIVPIPRGAVGRAADDRKRGEHPFGKRHLRQKSVRMCWTRWRRR